MLREEWFLSKTRGLAKLYGEPVVEVLRRRLMENVTFCGTDGIGVYVSATMAREMVW